MRKEGTEKKRAEQLHFEEQRNFSQIIKPDVFDCEKFTEMLLAYEFCITWEHDH